jgi:hypothetical protein
MISFYFALLALVAASIHVAVSAQRRSNGGAIAGTYLVYLLFIYVGLLGLLGAYAHMFRPVQTSASIGWSTSPYEFEVAITNLMLGTLGVLCLWFRDNFWLATVIANGVMMLGCAVGHVREVLLYNNHSEYNSGLFLATEIIMPIVMFILVIYYRAKTAKQ